MKTIVLENNEYEIIKNYKNGFSIEEVEKRYTDYFTPYDYILGDIAYGSLRLKGFYDSKNKKAKRINDYKNIDKYLEKNCAHDCKYFILKKVIKEKEVKQ